MSTAATHSLTHSLIHSLTHIVVRSFVASVVVGSFVCLLFCSICCCCCLSMPYSSRFSLGVVVSVSGDPGSCMSGMSGLVSRLSSLVSHLSSLVRPVCVRPRRVCCVLFASVLSVLCAVCCARMWFVHLCSRLLCSVQFCSVLFCSVCRSWLEVRAFLVQLPEQSSRLVVSLSRVFDVFMSKTVVPSTKGSLACVCCLLLPARPSSVETMSVSRC